MRVNHSTSRRSSSSSEQRNKCFQISLHENKTKILSVVKKKKRDTVWVVPQLLLQLHSLLLHLVQLLLQLSHLSMDVLSWDVLIRLHLRGCFWTSELLSLSWFLFIYKLLLMSTLSL